MQNSAAVRVEKFGNSQKRAQRNEDFSNQGKDTRKRNKMARKQRKDAENEMYADSY